MQADRGMIVGSTVSRSEVSVDDIRAFFRAEISEAISGVVDRDLFLQRLARRIADAIGRSSVALYTRTDTGDMLLRAGTAPSGGSIPRRIDAADPLTSVAGARVMSAMIGGGTEAVGALVVFAAPGEAVDASNQHLIEEIATIIAPAVTVAEHHHAVKQSSVIDLTTGIYNSAYLTQRFEEEIARARRSRNPVTVILVSLLNFETAQLALGYDPADQLLRDLAAEYAGLTRTFDVVGMQSRSEFGILLPETDIAGAATVVTRIHQRAARVIERSGIDRDAVPIQIVTGVASYPDDGDRVSAVMMAAEHRLSQNEGTHRRLLEQAAS